MISTPEPSLSRQLSWLALAIGEATARRENTVVSDAARSARELLAHGGHREDGVSERLELLAEVADAIQAGGARAFHRYWLAHLAGASVGAETRQ